MTRPTVTRQSLIDTGPFEQDHVEICFAALNRGRTAVMPGVYNKAKCYGQWVKQLFTYVGGAMLMCRSHSIRKNAVKWGQGSLVSSFVTLALPFALAPRPPSLRASRASRLDHR